MKYILLTILVGLTTVSSGFAYVSKDARLDYRPTTVKALSASAKEYNALILKGSKALQAGYNYRALKLFQEAESIALKPTHSFFIGVAHFRLKDFDTSLDYMNSTLEALKDAKKSHHKLLAQVFYYKGLVYKQKTNLISALLAMQKARSHVFDSKAIAFINGHLYAIEDAIKKDVFSHQTSIKLTENTEKIM